VTSPADHREAATLGPTATPSSGDRSLTVAFLHLAPELGALDRNRSLIEYGARLAADSGADWVLSGELVVPGYRFEPLIGTNWIAEQPDSWIRRLARLSSHSGVASFVSHPERETLTGKLFNSLFVIGRNGQILGRTGAGPARRWCAAARLIRGVVAGRMGAERRVGSADARHRSADDRLQSNRLRP
jgi:hypothetical protein